MSPINPKVVSNGSSPSVDPQPLFPPLGKTTVSSIKPKIVSTGFSPSIDPQPPYPPVKDVLLKFVQLYIVQTCVLGSFVVQGLGKGYQWTRLLAKENNIGDALYFTMVLSSVHTSMFLIINTRKYQNGCNLFSDNALLQQIFFLTILQQQKQPTSYLIPFRFSSPPSSTENHT